MKQMTVYVITGLELGWDCVCDVIQAESEEDALKQYLEDDGELAADYDFEDCGYIAHSQTLYYNEKGD